LTEEEGGEVEERAGEVEEEAPRSSASALLFL